MQAVVLLHGILERKDLDRAWQEIEDLVASGSKIITLVIESDGGAAQASMEFTKKLIALSQEKQIQIEAKIYNARSAAALISLAAEEREIAKNGSFAIHLGAITIEVNRIDGSGRIDQDLCTQAKGASRFTYDLFKAKTPGFSMDMNTTLSARNSLKFKPGECLSAGIVSRIF